MGVRIKDIAERVGVSPTTVSLVLNNKSGAGEELRDRILKTARELGYRSVRAAKAESLCLLRIARHGHTINRDHDVFIADYIEGLSQGAKQFNFSLEIISFNPSPIGEVLESVIDNSAAGFIVLGTELSREDVEAFASLHKPLAFIDTYHELMNFDFVDMNNEDSIFLLLQHLHNMGHRSIGFVKGAVETRNFRLREEGFFAGLRALGLEADRSHLFSVDQTFHGAYGDMKAILERRPALPTALVCANDIIASGCLRAFSEAGIVVPDDLSVVGFDDLPLSAVVDPALTTIQVSKAQIGRMAVQLVAARVRGDAELPSVKVLIGGKIVERRSVRRIGEAVQADGKGGLHEQVFDHSG
jgi:LacI family transcriptional regulator